MKKNPLLSRLPSLSLCISTMLAGVAVAQESPQPAQASSSAQSPTTRPQGGADLRELSTQLRDAKAAYNAESGGSRDLSRLRNAESRERLKQSLPPLSNKILELEKQVAAARSAPVAEGQVRAIQRARVDLDGIVRAITLIAVGDIETTAQINVLAKGEDPVTARAAKAKLAAAAYFTAATAEEQLKAVEGLKPLFVEADAKEPEVDAIGAVLLTSSTGTDAAAGISEILAASKPGQFTNSVLRQRESASYTRQVENKPVVLAGKTVDGKEFSTADLKGKVILIDFWATWCGPCKAELPRIKGLYGKYKEQGFEVVGISSDRSRDALTQYLAKDPELSWTNLFQDPQAGGSALHPIAAEFKITGIPRYFLIDRKGVLRSADARQQLETLIPKLLEENAG